MVSYSSFSENILKKMLKNPESFDKFPFSDNWDSNLPIASNLSTIKGKYPEAFKEKLDMGKIQSEIQECFKKEQESLELTQKESIRLIEESMTPKIERFYKILHEYTQMVVEGFTNSMIVFGQVGIGKCIFFDKDTFLVGGDGRLIFEKDLNIFKKKRKSQLFGLNTKLKIKKTRITDMKELESNEILKFTLRSGRDISVTPEHPFFTIDGWKQADTLKEGGFIATPRIYHINPKRVLSEHKVKLLALMISEGCMSKSGHFLFSTSEPELLKEFECLVKRFDKHLRLRKMKKYSYHIAKKKEKTGSNAVGKYLRKLNLAKKLSGEKFIPNEIMTLNLFQVSEFLGYLYAGDGYIGKGKVEYTSKSRLLARQIQHLLLRFGILSTVFGKLNKKYNQIYWTTSVLGKDNIIKFYENIRIPLRRKFLKLGKMVESYKTKKSNTNVDIIPIIRDPSRGGHFTRKSIQDTDLKHSEIFWDKIVSIKKKTGKFKVYDFTVLKAFHNFVANDIFIHNTFQILNILEKSKMPYIYHSGHRTPLRLFEFLYQHKDGYVLFFDDTTEIVHSKEAVCLPFYTKIITSKGIKEISDLLGDEYLPSYNFRLKKIELKPFKSKHVGLKPVIRIHTKKGIIECSPEHRWFVKKNDLIELKRAKDLNDDDHIIYIDMNELK